MLLVSRATDALAMFKCFEIAVKLFFGHCIKVFKGIGFLIAVNSLVH